MRVPRNTLPSKGVDAEYRVKTCMSLPLLTLLTPLFLFLFLFLPIPPLHLFLPPLWAHIVVPAIAIAIVMGCIVKALEGFGFSHWHSDRVKGIEEAVGAVAMTMPITTLTWHTVIISSITTATTAAAIIVMSLVALIISIWQRNLALLCYFHKSVRWMRCLTR